MFTQTGTAENEILLAQHLEYVIFITPRIFTESAQRQKWNRVLISVQT